MSGSRPASRTVSRQVGAHHGVPIEDSRYRERTQHPAILVQEACHPVIALCGGCHARIRRVKPWQPWEHEPTARGRTPRSAPAVVHAGTGSKLGPDEHLVAPIDAAVVFRRVHGTARSGAG